LGAAEDQEYRFFSGCNSSFTATRVRETLVEMTDKNCGEENYDRSAQHWS
jgi:hypothetical protein